MRINKFQRISFFLIIILAIFFRFYNLNWDDNYHLHPDERFLTMVGNAMILPKNIGEYLDPLTSKVNPANIGYRFFVYGTFPLILNKYLAVFLNLDNYNDFVILGRFLSAFFDLLTVVLVYKTAKLLGSLIFGANSKKALNFSLWSTFFYAIAVLPIQLSHFFAVDTFLNFFMFGSFYLTLKYSHEKVLSIKYQVLSISGIFFGFALACKITAVYIFPSIVFFIFIGSKYSFKKFLILTTYFLILAYLSLRLVNPYYFQTKYLFDLRPSQLLVENLRLLKSFDKADIWYPPAVQWIKKPNITFSLVNLAVFGVGIPYFILIIIGMIWIIFNFRFSIFKKISNFLLLIILFWVVGFFLYQSSQFVKAMRYFIFIYPFLAIFAAIGLQAISNWLLAICRRKKITCYMLYVTCFVLLLLWPLMFSSIYFHKHTRIEASEWMYQNLPNGSLILAEEWDDPLPLGIKDTFNKQFQTELLPVFGMDTTEKWKKMNELLSKADYYILSSNRGWGSIPTVPEKYPKMSKFYKNLLKSNCQSPQPDRLRKDWPDSPCYIKIKEFKPYYYRFFELPNHWIDESFTVYDHPTVIILKKLGKNKTPAIF